MDCRLAQQLVSPYLDQQMTGAEMMEMRQHLAECRHCAEEYLAAREVKFLLRSLAPPAAVQSLETNIQRRLSQEQSRPEILLPWPPTRLTPPVAMLPATWSAPIPRGRRIGAALALSCLAVLTVAAPFAPGTSDVEARALGRPSASSLAGDVFAGPMPGTAQRPAPAFGSPWIHAVSTTDSAQDAVVEPPQAASRPEVAPPRDISPTLDEAGAEPLGDEAVSGYAGDVTLAAYRR